MCCTALPCSWAIKQPRKGWNICVVPCQLSSLPPILWEVSGSPWKMVCSSAAATHSPWHGFGHPQLIKGEAWFFWSKISEPSGCCWIKKSPYYRNGNTLKSRCFTLMFYYFSRRFCICSYMKRDPWQLYPFARTSMEELERQHWSKYKEMKETGVKEGASHAAGLQTFPFPIRD